MTRSLLPCFVASLLMSLLLVCKRTMSQNSHFNSQSVILFNKLRSSEYSLRPQPADDLPVLDLVESTDPRYDPPDSQRNYTALKTKLAQHFDPQFMSDEQPGDSKKNPNGTMKLPFRRGRKGRLVPLGPPSEALREVNLRHLLLPGGKKVQLRLGPRLKRKLMRFLQAYTTCPVIYKWRDVGIRFWPRWIKVGHCDNTRSCSIPPGMKCKSSVFSEKVILRWHCANYERNHKCRWLPVRYPVVMECECGCNNSSHERNANNARG